MKPRVHIDEEGRRVRTTLPDGSVIDAVPQYDEESIARAKALGFDTVWQMTRSHDLLHCLIADSLGHAHSASLHLVAHPEQGNAHLRRRAAEEECLVFLIQRLMNEGPDRVLEAHGMAA